MYPTIIVVLVHYKNSKEETYGISALVANVDVSVRDVEAHPVTVGHLYFAVPLSKIDSTGSDV